MAKIQRGLHSLSVGVWIIASLVHGQTTPTETTVEDALHHMSDQAGVVFLGEVIAIRHIAGENGASGVVEVDFRVDQAVRGCVAGSTYVLREWAGLWSGGDQRYRIGQRLLMLLHSPGADGVASPVGGMMGAIPIRGSANSIQSSVSTASTTSPPVADLRWIGTRLQHSIMYRDPSSLLATASSNTANDAAADASIAAQQASVDVVINMLSAWQKKDVR